jgi:two-component system, NtrC family, nitrogen regulation response regulator NtrX
MRPCALLVDDDAATLRVLPEVLRLHLPNMAVHACNSAVDALDRLKARPYHVVLSDIRMPTMDGFAFLKNIKNLRPEIPVVLTTGEADSTLLTKALDAGAFDFLPKPFDRRDLVSTFELAIRAYALARGMKATQQHIAHIREHLTENSSRSELHSCRSGAITGSH